MANLLLKIKKIGSFFAQQLQFQHKSVCNKFKKNSECPREDLKNCNLLKTFLYNLFSFNCHKITLIPNLNNSIFCNFKVYFLSTWGPFHQMAYACRNSTTVVNIALSQIEGLMSVSSKGVT